MNTMNNHEQIEYDPFNELVQVLELYLSLSPSFSLSLSRSLPQPPFSFLAGLSGPSSPRIHHPRELSSLLTSTTPFPNLRILQYSSLDPPPRLFCRPFLSLPTPTLFFLSKYFPFEPSRRQFSSVHHDYPPYLPFHSIFRALAARGSLACTGQVAFRARAQKKRKIFSPNRSRLKSPTRKGGVRPYDTTIRNSFVSCAPLC